MHILLEPTNNNVAWSLLLSAGRYANESPLNVADMQSTNTNFFALYLFEIRPSCPSSLFQTWETFMQEIEADSITATDVAKTLSRQVRFAFNGRIDIGIDLHF